VGKSPTNKRLVIWVDKKWASRPELLALSDKGHTILPIPETDMAPDIVLSVKAHYWDEPFFTKPTYLESALKRARKEKAGK
jgi:hypothetical protein